MKPGYQVTQPASALPPDALRKGLCFPDDTWQYTAVKRQDFDRWNAASNLLNLYLANPAAPVDPLPPGQLPHAFLSSSRQWTTVSYWDLTDRPQVLPMAPHYHAISDIYNLQITLNTETDARVTGDTLLQTQVTVINNGEIWCYCPLRNSRYKLIMVPIDINAPDGPTNVTLDWQGPYALI